MRWDPLDEFVSESEHGHRVARCYVSKRVIYVAFEPPIDQSRFHAQLRARYERGQPVPTRRKCIGAFDTYDAAIAACSPHLPKNDVKAAVSCGGEIPK